MEISFVNKKVLVTGAGKGIGRDLCKKLLKCGASVIGVSRTQSALDSLAKEAPAIKTICLDIAEDWNKIKKVIEEIGPVDCLVNNAAVAICTPFLDVQPEEFDVMFNVNVKALLNVSQTVARAMVKNKIAGSIVNISSQASQAALKDHIVYSGTKSAVDIMSRIMALELGPYNIRVNCVNPTVVMTDMGRVGWSDPAKADQMLSKIPLHRFAEVYEVVNTILFLLSDVAPMVNAVTLPVDGGFLAC